MPVINHMRAHLRGADRVFVDETRAPVLDPGRKRTKSGYFWAVVSDDRGHGGAGPPIVLFHYAPGRGKEHPLNFLAGYQGRFLQCDSPEAVRMKTMSREELAVALPAGHVADQRRGLSADRGALQDPSPRDAILKRHRRVCQSSEGQIGDGL